MVGIRKILFSFLAMVTTAAAFASVPSEQTLKEFQLEGRVVIGFQGSVTLWDDQFTAITNADDITTITAALARKNLSLLSKIYTNPKETVVICIVKAERADAPFHLLVMDQQGAHGYNISAVQPGRIQSKDEKGLYPDLILTVN